MKGVVVLVLTGTVLVPAMAMYRLPVMALMLSRLTYCN